MKNNFNNLSLRKKILFSIIPLIILLIFAEMGARFIYFEKTKKSSEPLALISTYRYIKVRLLRRQANKIVGELPEGKNLTKALYSDMGKELLDSFKLEYEDNFKLLVEEANKIGSKFIVLYAPLDHYKSSSTLDDSRQFFSGLAEKYNVDFLDMTDDFFQYSEETVTLLPENGHLSRFGNKLVIERLSEYIDKYNDYRMNFQFDSRPKLFGDLSSNHNSVWEIVPDLPYRVIANKQGLRMNYNLAFPKEKQRILILGDSCTFGPYLANYNTYPALLDKRYPDKEVINAGIAGYTITDETSLFIERAKYAEPDITILQVIDNDIYGLFYFRRNQFNREGKVYQPSKVEIEFLNKVKE